jgi:hypothetical protein
MKKENHVFNHDEISKQIKTIKTMSYPSQTDNGYKLEISTYNQPTIRLIDYPFKVTFTWEEKQIAVQLDNGEDVLKLANLFSNFLTSNNIPNTVSEIDKK